MTGEIKGCGLDILFMDGGRHQSLDLSVPEGFRSRYQRLDGVLARELRQLPGYDGDLFLPDIIDIELFGGDTGEILGILIVQITVGDGLTVKIHQFVGAEYQRGAQFQETMIRKGLDDQFCSDSIRVAGGDSYDGSLLKAHA